jgi:hypothetical protein
VSWGRRAPRDKIAPRRRSTAGRFDGPTAFTPEMDLYWSSAQPLMQAGGDRTRFAKMPG